MKLKLISSIGLAGMIFLMSSSCSKEKGSPLYGNEKTPLIKYNWSAVADSVQEATYNAFLAADGKTFKQDNSGNNTFNYWPNAHVLDVFTDGFLRTKNDAYKQKMKALVAGIKAKNGNTYINNFYDDMEWLALSTLRAYQATNDADFLDVATLLWTDIKTGINSNLGGGIAWKKDQLAYKNTPANAPAIIMAARLYQLQNKPEDLETAKQLYTWLKTNLVDPSTGEVWDGINRTGDGSVDKTWIFTYNQGVFVGAGLELYRATKDRAYLTDALKTANNAMNSSLSPGGILKNENQGDGGLFKGILVRYFTLLSKETAVSDGDRANLTKFLRFNAETFYNKALSRPALMSGSDWTKKPDGATDLTTQLSGLMLIEAATTLP